MNRCQSFHLVRTFRLLFSCLVFFGLTATSPAFGTDAQGELGMLDSAPRRDRVHVNLVAAVVWEGSSLRNSDLAALKLLRDKLPDQKFTHFVNPAYFLRDNEKAGEHSAPPTAKIAATMRPGDGVALHLAPWKSLVSRAGVVFRDGPTFWGNSLNTRECRRDCGREVPLSIYPPEDVRKIAATGASTLELFGFGRTQAAQVSGWMATASVLEQLAAIGYTADFSSIAPSSVKAILGRFPIYNWISDTWSDDHPRGISKVIMTPQGAITTHPSSGGIADHHTVKEITAAFEELISPNSSAPKSNRYFYLGMHQETASRFADRFALAMESIRAIAASRNVEITTLVPQGGTIPTAAMNVSH